MTNIEDRLSKLNTFKSIQLTEEEKNSLRAHGAHIISTHVPNQTESFLYRGLQHGLRIALSTFIFVVFIGSSLSVIANSALPGDPLYTFKVGINEQMQKMLLDTTEEKVAYEKSRIENRTDEIRTLAETKTLTKAKQQIVNKALDNHVKALSKELTTLSDEAPSAALTVTASLEENLLATKAALSSDPNTQGDPTVVGALEAVDETLKVVSEEEVKIISKEIDNIVNAVQTVPSANSTVKLEAGLSSDKKDTATTTPTQSTPIEP